MQLGIAAAAAIVASTSALGVAPTGWIAAGLLLAAACLYRFPSTVAGALYLLAAGVWLVVARRAPGPALAYWAFVALALPPSLKLLSQGRERWGQRLLAWGLVLSFMLAALYGLEIRVRDVAAVLFPAICSALLMSGCLPAPPLWKASGRNANVNAALAPPARWLGALGIAASLLLFSGEQAWGFAGVVDAPGVGVLDLGGSLTLAVCASAVSLVGAMRARDQGRWHLVLAGLYPLVVLPALVLIHAGLGDAPAESSRTATAAALYMSGYAIALGLATLRWGFRQESLVAGMAGWLLASAVLLNRMRLAELGTAALALLAVALLLLGGSVARRLLVAGNPP